jgi:hypothetical protein
MSKTTNTRTLRSEVPEGVRFITAEGEVLDGFTVANHEHDDRVSYDAQNAADAASGWLQAHDPSNGVVRFIGATARTMREQAASRRFWSGVMFDGRLAYVTLDTDPEVKGRPESLRPRTPAVVAVDCEGWGDGGATVALVYVDPVSSFMVDDPQPYDPANRKELAKYDAASAVAILKFHRWDFDDVEAWQAEGRAAVRAIAGPPTGSSDRNGNGPDGPDPLAAAAALRALARL